VNERVNMDVAAKLDEVAALLRSRGRTPPRSRVPAGRSDPAAASRPVTMILAAEGIEGLERLPGIGQSLARAIRDIVRLGYFPILERLRGDADPVRLLKSVPYKAAGSSAAARTDLLTSCKRWSEISAASTGR